MSSNPEIPKFPTFPPHSSPRVWFLTSANSPVGLSLCRSILAHGDYVTAGVHFDGLDEHEQQSTALKSFLEEIQQAEASDDAAAAEAETNAREADESDDPQPAPSAKTSWSTRLRIVPLDVRVVGQCQTAVAETVRCFGRVDILFCSNSEAVLGTVEELSQNPKTLSLVRDQFETNLFGPINIIKACLPVMRKNNFGHIVLLTAITGHLGTPGLSIFCASQWAIEGYCDTLAYEIAPFNIRLTIVQPNMEVNVLTHRITSAPPMSCYTEENNPAPLSRNIFSSLLDKIEGTAEPTTGDQLHSNETQSLYPELSKSMKEGLVAETVHAIAAIGGHENPPARHIIGLEAIASVRAKLKTVSEELEDFVECSAATDMDWAVPSDPTP